MQNLLFLATWITDGVLKTMYRWMSVQQQFSLLLNHEVWDLGTCDLCFCAFSSPSVTIRFFDSTFSSWLYLIWKCKETLCFTLTLCSTLGQETTNFKTDKSSLQLQHWLHPLSPYLQETIYSYWNKEHLFHQAWEHLNLYVLVSFHWFCQWIVHPYLQMPPLGQMCMWEGDPFISLCTF